MTMLRSMMVELGELRSIRGTPMPFHRAPGTRAHRQWKQRRASGRRA